jgi:hypothetical protein
MNDNYYNYLFEHILKYDTLEMGTLTQYNHLYLCAYSINTNNSKPFICYLLSNEHEKFSFPCFDLSLIDTKLNNEVDFIQVAKSYLYNVCEHNNENNCIEYNGYHEYNHSLYLFFDITKLSLIFHYKLDSLKKHKQLALMDEIINHKKILDIEIDIHTTQFFIHNHLSIYLYDEHNEPYEIPIVGFVYKKTISDLNFTFIFGENNQNKMGIFGPYYYFSDFQNTRKNMDKETNNKLIVINQQLTDSINIIYSHVKPTVCSYLKDLNYGIVRFALFMGYSKYIENFPNDTYDLSSIKEEKMSDPFLNKTYEILTQRISDHDGLWSIDYDSIYLGKVQLDDGNYLENTPLYVVKKFENQIPLSYHQN